MSKKTFVCALCGDEQESNTEAAAEEAAVNFPEGIEDPVSVCTPCYEYILEQVGVPNLYKENDHE